MTAPCFLGGNWKMFRGGAGAGPYFTEFLPALPADDRVEVMIAPPFTALGEAAPALSGTPVALGAQDCHWAEEGAHTGEISPRFLAELGCRYVIVGHSERRAMGEDDALVARKLAAAVAADLVPVFCVGETEAERDAGRTAAVVERQVATGLEGAGALSALVIAYEPVWAIGTGRTPTPAEAAAVHARARAVARAARPELAPEALRVIYGGSVKPDNIAHFLGETEIQGALVGGASVDPASFLQLITNALAV